MNELEDHPEIITEGMQPILRREGVELPYEQLSKLARGKKVTLAELHEFADCLNIPERAKKELKELKPNNYLGKAELLTGK